MPTLAIIDGVKLQFYARAHPPRHFHAEFAEYRAVVDIERLEIVRGTLPESKRRAVLGWAATRTVVSAQTFARAVAKLPLAP